jgi:hypothetical protein
MILNIVAIYFRLYSNNCLKSLNKVIQEEANKVAEWLNVNKLSLNIKKTKYIIFRSTNKKLKQDVKVDK